MNWDQYITSMRKQGSPVYPVNIGALAAAASERQNIRDIDRNAYDIYEYLDSAVVINNSAQPITVRIGTSDYRILAYTTQSITKVIIRELLVTNSGTAATLAGEVRIELRRLPVNIQMVSNVR